MKFEELLLGKTFRQSTSIAIYLKVGKTSALLLKSDNESTPPLEKVRMKKRAEVDPTPYIRLAYILPNGDHVVVKTPEPKLSVKPKKGISAQANAHLKG